MPITHTLLRNISVTYPRAGGHAETISHMRVIPHQVNVLTEDEMQFYARKIPYAASL